MVLLSVPVNDIDTAGMSAELEIPVAWLESQLSEADASARAAGELKVRLSRSGRADVVVRGQIAAEIELPCARCLAPTAVSVRAELSLLLKPKAGGPPPKAPSSRGTMKKPASATPAPVAVPKGPAKTAESSKKAATKRPAAEYEFSSEEADLDEYDGERVVLDGFVREAILLELPSFPLCGETCDGGEQAALLGRAREQAAAQDAAAKKSPFEALRHLMTDSPLPSDDALGNEGPPPKRPSAAEVRRATRVSNRGKPKIKSSIVGQRKK